MKTLVTFCAALLLAVPAYAEGRNGSSFSQSESGATSIVDTTSEAGASVVINNAPSGPEALGSESNQTYVNTDGELRTAPSLGGLALGGGHPCAYAPSTAQISAIGGGLGFGGMKVDSACMLMVMGAAGNSKAYTAANYMLAARDPLACVAMREAGMINPDSQCAGGGLLRPSRPATQPSSFTASAKNSAMPAKCVMDAGKVVIRYTAGDKAAQKANCLNSLGY